jgi:hypothetical protein
MWNGNGIGIFRNKTMTRTKLYAPTTLATPGYTEPADDPENPDNDAGSSNSLSR